jgi:RNA polymerase sigma factor (sigma-70 family)
VIDPLEHLFRRESGRIVATLVRILGVQHLALAEDVVQEAFCRALEVWKFRGMPRNAPAWLMVTAKNCALDALRRQRTARSAAPELANALQSEWTLAPTLEEMFASHDIKDDLLRMMFSCCHPQLPETAQIALILHILCGFNVQEVAGAFLSGHAAMEKRIARAKKVLAQSERLFDVTAPEDFAQRLPIVHSALYLLFSEGYHGASADAAVRAELCGEAMRLCTLLLEHPFAATSTTCALAALMYLNAARLPARADASGNLLALLHQDRSLWDRELVAQGLALLQRSAQGQKLSRFHLEAAIASLHATASETESTAWPQVVALYDALMQIHPSPVIALNRAIAVAQSEGAERGLDEIQQIADRKRLQRYPFYRAAMGELELQRGRPDAARDHFDAARALARNTMERHFLEQRLRACEAASR